MNAVASEMKSKLYASHVKPGRCRSYSKKYGTVETRAMKPIQNSRLLEKMMSHGQLPFRARKVPRMGSDFLSTGMISFKFRNATR